MINLLTKKMCPFLRFLSAMAQHQLPLDVANEPGQASIFFRNNTKTSLGRLGPSNTQVRNSRECDSFGFQNKIGPRAQKHDQLKRIATRTGLVTASTPCRFSAVTWFTRLYPVLIALALKSVHRAGYIEANSFCFCMILIDSCILGSSRTVGKLKRLERG